MTVLPTISLQDGDVLIVVDVQNDFLPGGALGVPHGEAVIPVLNAAIKHFHDRGLLIVVTRDWHPANHCSFRGQGGPWPPHCIAHTLGAALAADLRLPPDVTVISKAAMPDEEAYSGFNGTRLEGILRVHRAQRLFIGGLATEYCVLHTVKDAVARRFETYVLKDAIRAVNMLPDDGAKAEREMVSEGAHLITLEMIA